MSSAAAGPGPEDGSPRPAVPREEERQRLERWLDAGLRRGEAGRLAREYPLSMAGSRGHRCVFEAGAPVAHAMLHPIRAVSRSRTVPVGLIGNVYTEPARRGAGLASACVDACVDDARSLGLPLALLWSDAWDFYRRLGFHPAGREHQLTLDAALLRRAAPEPGALQVGAVRDDDWPALEALYRDKPQHARRQPGDLARLAAAPATALRVARDGRRVAGYAAAGRGADFGGAVHEWAGEADAVLACLASLHREAGAGVVLGGPEDEPALTRLRRAGAEADSGCFALVRLLDAGTLWRAIAPRSSAVVFRQQGERVALAHGKARAELTSEAALDLFFGAGTDGPVGRGLPRAIRRRLATTLPWPLYLWGFDSI